MPDAPNHGARFTGNEQARLGQFWHILHGSLTEFAGLRDALYEAGLVAEKRLAVAGASMGGMTALGIMTHHPEVKSVACLMGSGYFTSLAKTLFPPSGFSGNHREAGRVGSNPGIAAPGRSSRFAVAR